jgi:hypothetical protein
MMSTLTRSFPLDEPTYRTIPGTAELLEAVKRPGPKLLESSDKFFGITGVALWLMMTALILLGQRYAWALTGAVWALMALLMLAIGWAIWQALEVLRAWRQGFTPHGEAIDQAIAKERQWIEKLVHCDPQALREHSNHLDLEAKQRTRRAGLTTVLLAIGVAAVSLLDTGEKAQFWSSPTWFKLGIQSSSLGFLIGALVLAVLAGRLERVAGLLTLAADRAERKTHS